MGILAIVSCMLGPFRFEPARLIPGTFLIVGTRGDEG